MATAPSPYATGNPWLDELVSSLEATPGRTAPPPTNSLWARAGAGARGLPGTAMGKFNAMPGWGRFTLASMAPYAASSAVPPLLNWAGVEDPGTQSNVAHYLGAGAEGALLGAPFGPWGAAIGGGANLLAALGEDIANVDIPFVGGGSPVEMPAYGGADVDPDELLAEIKRIDPEYGAEAKRVYDFYAKQKEKGLPIMQPDAEGNLVEVDPDAELYDMYQNVASTLMQEGLAAREEPESYWAAYEEPLRDIQAQLMADAAGWRMAANANLDMMANIYDEWEKASPIFKQMKPVFDTYLQGQRGVVDAYFQQAYQTPMQDIFVQMFQADLDAQQDLMSGGSFGSDLAALAQQMGPTAEMPTSELSGNPWDNIGWAG